MRARGASAGWSRAALAAGAALALCWPARPAHAEGLSGSLSTDYTRTWGTATDQSGRAESTGNDALTERLLFSLDRRLWPALAFSAAGLLEQDFANSALGGSLTDSTARAANLNTALALSGPLFNATVGWVHRLSSSGGLAGASTLILDGESLLLGWRPSGLPPVALRLENTWTRDPTRTGTDTQVRSALLTTSFSPARAVSLSYSLSATNPVDNLAQSQLWTVTQSLHGGVTGKLFTGQTTVSANVDLSDQRSKVGALGGGATRTTQVLPQGGLSLVEAFPATPELDVLAGNPALVDGSTTAAVGLNRGFGPALAGDLALRDAGAQLLDAAAAVNLLYLWVDRRLPDAVAQALAAGFAVYQSDDNQRWTQVALAGPVRFGTFDNRFELPIATTAARNLKLVARALGTAVTTDRQLGDIFVTELQLFLVEALSSGQEWQARSSGAAQLAARTPLGKDLAHDVTLLLRSPLGGPGPNTWQLGNGLTFSRKLNRIWLAGARASRQDFDQGQGHRGETQVGASLSVTPLPTTSESLTWSARWADANGGMTFTQGVSLFARAQLYRGVGVQAGYGFTAGSEPTGLSTRSTNVTAGLSVEPNPQLSLSGTYGHSGTRSFGAGRPETRSAGDNLSAAISFRPFAALFASAGLTWLSSTERSNTLASFSVGASPFRDGDLQVAINYSETLQDGLRTRILSPGLRWNLGTPVALLTVTYARSSTDSEVLHSTVNTFNASLQLRL